MRRLSRQCAPSLGCNSKHVRANVRVHVCLKQRVQGRYVTSKACLDACAQFVALGIRQGEEALLRLVLCRIKGGRRSMHGVVAERGARDSGHNREVIEQLRVPNGVQWPEGTPTVHAPKLLAGKTVVLTGTLPTLSRRWPV